MLTILKLLLASAFIQLILFMVATRPKKKVDQLHLLRKKYKARKLEAVENN